MDELFGAIAEGAVEFASSGSSGYGSRGRPEDQRIPCSLTCFGKWDIIQEVCMLVSPQHIIYSTPYNNNHPVSGQRRVSVTVVYAEFHSLEYRCLL